MGWLNIITYFAVTFVCLSALISFTDFGPQFFDVMVDRHGRWRVPTSGTVTQISNSIIKVIPRFDTSFSPLQDTQFDMDNSNYVQSTIMYVIIFAIIGAIFGVIILIVLISRYCCNCCGGRDVRRKGYPENQINFYRYAIIVISFILEAILIYGYFANSDLHNALSVLIDSFETVSKQILDQMALVTIPSERIPAVPDNINMSLFIEDFQFSTRYAGGQINSMVSFLDKFEKVRMAFIILNLIAATIGCSLGIASGSVRKGTPVLVMVILFAIADVLFFISFGIHFSGAKLVYDYCSEINNYLDLNVDDMIPMRLQYFIPCVNSPVFPFIKDHIYFLALNDIDELKNQLTDKDWSTYISWNNLSIYEENITALKNETVNDKYTEALNTTTQMRIIEQSVTCRWSKNETRLDEWLLCTYSQDNIDMIMITQGAGCIILLILTILGIPAIKRFKFAGNANLGGVLDGKKGFMGQHARAKR